MTNTVVRTVQNGKKTKTYQVSVTSLASKARIVNVAKYKFDIRRIRHNFPHAHLNYVGRGVKRKEGWAFSKSPLANPYSVNNKSNAIHVESKDEEAQSYRRWLWEQIKRENQAVLGNLRHIDEYTVFLCHCDRSDQHCHAHVIYRAALWLRNKELAHMNE